MITVDCRCQMEKCTIHGPDIYRMVGYCTNCGTKPILFLFSRGTEARAGEEPCPICGVRYRLTAQRVATLDEIPEAIDSPPPAPGGRKEK